MNILYKPIGTEYNEPTRGTSGAAGWDLYSAADVTLEPTKPVLVPTQMEIAIPADHMLLILPRSGNALKKNLLIPNSPGLIDEDYRGHLQVILTYIPDVTVERTNLEDFRMTIKKGERIAQAVLVPYVKQFWQKVSELPSTERGGGGFGSTGH